MKRLTMIRLLYKLTIAPLLRSRLRHLLRQLCQRALIATLDTHFAPIHGLHTRLLTPATLFIYLDKNGMCSRTVRHIQIMWWQRNWITRYALGSAVSHQNHGRKNCSASYLWQKITIGLGCLWRSLQTEWVS